MAFGICGIASRFFCPLYQIAIQYPDSTLHSAQHIAQVMDGCSTPIWVGSTVAIHGGAPKRGGELWGAHMGIYRTLCAPAYRPAMGRSIEGERHAPARPRVTRPVP